MPQVKKLVMHGFKSFANRTEIQFEDAMNVIVGPNGSGKSNIMDALCFVLGRLSTKSIRVTKSANLIFSGNKIKKPAQEGIVELIFNNEDQGFSLDAKEVIIKRIVRRNGQSIYKINNETKTRGEMLELLAQAGIDPYGFNIVLQGEIDSFVKMSSEERRKVIEGVAGISIYEIRKQKSLKELEKTEERLKEVGAVLRERNSYLKNLEKEKQEAENFQKLETMIKRCKATILNKKLGIKKDEKTQIENKIQEQEKTIQKIKKQIQEKTNQLEELKQKIEKINKTIEDSTSGEQEGLHNKVSELKAAQAGLEVRKENFENHLKNTHQKIQNQKVKLQQLEKEVSEISSPKIKKQQEKLKEQQEKFDILEKNRRKFYQIKAELSTFEAQRQDKQNSQIEIKRELELIQKTINSLFEEIKYEKSNGKSIALKQKTSEELKQIDEKILKLNSQELELEKEIAIGEKEISANEKLKKDIPKMEICPLCKNKITEEHTKEVISNANTKIESWKNKLTQNHKEKQTIKEQLENTKQNYEKLKIKSNEIEIDILKLKNAQEKKVQIEKLVHTQSRIEEEISELKSQISKIRVVFEKLKNIEEDYDTARLKLNEFSFADIDVDTETTIKKREIERTKIEIKANTRETEESQLELKKIIEFLGKTQKQIQEKEKQEQEIFDRCEKLFMEKNSIQDQQKAIETEIIGFQHNIRSNEEKANSFKIEKARVSAEQEALEHEYKEFENLEIISLPIEQVQQRLQKSELRISNIGSVNLRALEVYEKVKEQCALIEGKVQTIDNEKEKILVIISQIDKTKKKAFMNTLIGVNEIFTRNFSQLSKKGIVFLDLENKKEPFDGGLNILVKVGKGKYFDVKSLSGGEKTLVALALIFAIQEYKPYHFYILDEIDAALDKHNSELLAALLQKHMQDGQYIIISHNDALISGASTLYGVSMQENISKVISLKI